MQTQHPQVLSTAHIPHTVGYLVLSAEVMLKLISGFNLTEEICNRTVVRIVAHLPGLARLLLGCVALASLCSTVACLGETAECFPHQ